MFCMGKKDDDDFWGFVTGLALGAIGLAILAKATNPVCPNCKNSVKRGDSICQHCGILLEWK